MRAFVVLLAVVLPARGDDKPVSFINDVAPILKENCFACHDARRRSRQVRHDHVREARGRRPGGDRSPPASRTTASSTTSSPPTTTAGCRPRTRARRCRRRRPRSSPGGSRRGPSSTPGSTRRPTWSRNSASAGSRRPPPAVVPVPGHRQRPRVHPGRQAPRRRRAPRTDRLGRRRTASSRSGSAPGPSGPTRWRSCPTASSSWPAAGPGRRGTCASTTSTPRARPRTASTVLDGVNDPKVLVKHLLDADDAVLCLAVAAGRQEAGRRRAATGPSASGTLPAGWPRPSSNRRSRTTPTGCSGVAFAPDGKHLAHRRPRQDGQGVGLWPRRNRC